MKFISKQTVAALIGVGLLLASSPAFASKTLCVFDLAGANGPSYAAMKVASVRPSFLNAGFMRGQICAR